MSSGRMCEAVNAFQDLMDSCDDNELSHKFSEGILLEYLKSGSYSDKYVAEMFERTRDKLGFWYA